MKILVLGSKGMLGHVVHTYFQKQGYDVYGTTRETNNKYYFDANQNITGINNIIAELKPHVIINCIGILNNDAENNKKLAVMVNSYLPHYLNELSEEYDFKFIHVSTDCVFDGKKGSYSEDAPKDATSFYGQSKALGEINNNRNLTLRTSIVGPDINPNGKGLFQWFMNQTDSVGGYKKVIWTGVTTIQLAKAMEEAINNNITGLYHVVNDEKIDKYSLLKLFKKYFARDIIINENDNFESNKSLIRTRDDYKFNVPSYEQMIQEMRDWVLENEHLYPELLEKIGKTKNGGMIK
jgi:dTDP-4-dehydrorhamnose reductase